VNLPVNKGTFLVVLLAAGLGAAALVGGGVVVGTICALGLVFVLPGVALAFYAPLGANRAERFALMLALGVALLVLMSILIAAVGLKLDTVSWVLALVDISILGCVVAVVLAPRGTRGGMRRPSLRVPLGGALAAVVIVAAIVAAILVTVESKQAQDRKSQFTQVWTLPETASRGAKIGIANSEAGARSYQVSVKANGRVIRTWGPVRLDPGGLWERRLDAPAWARRVHVEVAGTGEGKTIHRTTTVTLG
jgi:hypothetical protein